MIEPNRNAHFAASPLITPERVKLEAKAIFSLEVRPTWVKGIELLSTDPVFDGSGEPTEAVVLVGRKHLLAVTVNLFALAALYEMTRFGGIRVVTNSNHARQPSIYAKMSFLAEPGHLVSIRRILFDAKGREMTKPLWLERDYSPESTCTEADGHPERPSRSVAMLHVEQEAHHRAPPSFDVPAYLANIQALFAEVDRLRDGIDA